MQEKQITIMLRSLGITHSYLGYRRIVLAVTLALDNPDRLEAVIKEIYRPVAAACGCRWTAVERTLRTLSHRAWQVNPRLLSQMAGYPLRRAPSAAQFLEILTVHAARNFILPL